MLKDTNTNNNGADGKSKLSATNSEYQKNQGEIFYLISQ